MSTTIHTLALFVFMALIALASGSDLGRFLRSGEVSSDSLKQSSSSDSSSSSSSSSSDTDSDQQHDQRRIELAVQAALLKGNAPAFPQVPTFRVKSYQIQFTTLLDRFPDNDFGHNVANPVFGPAAVITTTSPDGIWGPQRTRTDVIKLDTAVKFGTLFANVRKAGFLNELDLRTLVSAEGRFSLKSKALLTPCFPITDEPGLLVDVIALIQNRPQVVGTLRRKLLAIDAFFNLDRSFVNSFSEEIPITRYNPTFARFDSDVNTAAVMTVSACSQFSYFQ